MAKICSNCNSKIGFLDQDLKFKNKKYICGNCIKKYHFSKDSQHDIPTTQAITWADNHSFDDFQNLISNGEDFQDVIDKQEKIKAQKEAEVAPTDFQSTSSNTVIQKAANKINELAIPKEIKKQLIDAQVFDFWFNNKELKSLQDILEYKNGEVIKYATSGLKEEQNESRTVLILCTNRRVLFLNKNMFFGGDSTDIPLNMVNSVQLTTHLLLADITIINGATATKLKQLNKDAARILAKTIKEESLKFQQRLLHPQSESNSNQQLDIPDQIRKYKQLADDGIITEDEFNAKKKQLLGL